MNVLGAGARLWTPRRHFIGGGLQLNTSHFAYPFLVAAMGPSNGSGSTPPIYRGPQAPATFPLAFTATAGTLNAPTTDEYGAALSFSTGTVQTVNQDVFGALTNTSFVGAFTPTSANSASDCIVRKDAEWTPLQFDAGATTVRVSIWTSAGLENRAYPLAFATNDIVHCAMTLAGTAHLLYQSVNRGAISVAPFTSAGNGIIAAGATGTPVAIGGAEGGTNLFKGKLHFAYWFAKTILTADQVAQLFLDPAALFVPAEPELPAMAALLLYLRPDADSIDGGWTNELGGTVLFSSIDETVASDTDYIQSSINPVADIAKISLSDPATGIGTPVILRYRYKMDGGPTATLGVRLLQGSTEIAVYTHSSLSSSFVTAEQTLTGPQLASISDFNDLYIEFTANT